MILQFMTVSDAKMDGRTKWRANTKQNSLYEVF